MNFNRLSISCKVRLEKVNTKSNVQDHLRLLLKFQKTPHLLCFSDILCLCKWLKVGQLKRYDIRWSLTGGRGIRGIGLQYPPDSSPRLVERK